MAYLLGSFWTVRNHDTDLTVDRSAALRARGSLCCCSLMPFSVTFRRVCATLVPIRQHSSARVVLVRRPSHLIPRASWPAVTARDRVPSSSATFAGLLPSATFRDVTYEAGVIARPSRGRRKSRCDAGYRTVTLTCRYASRGTGENRLGKIANVALYRLSYTPVLA
jgi:hypothetical protein